MAELIIDGDLFGEYGGFVDEFNRAYLAAFGGPPWDGEDFNDLDDFLAAPGGRLTIRWRNARKSMVDLGHKEMAWFWARALGECRGPSPALESVAQRHQEWIDRAAAGLGPTLFDWLVQQLGDEEHVDLRLEQGGRRRGAAGPDPAGTDQPTPAAAQGHAGMCCPVDAV